MKSFYDCESIIPVKTQNIKEAEEIEHVQGDVVELNGTNVRMIERKVSPAEHKRAVNLLAQIVNIGKLATLLDETTEYVVKIPAKYKDAFEAGELFLNKSAKTGLEYPTLMKKMPDGKYQIVDMLTVERKIPFNGEIISNFCNGIHDILMQKQLNQIARSLEKITDHVRIIEQGQHADRIAEIKSGQSIIMQAIKLTNINERRIKILDGIEKIDTGQWKIASEMKSSIENYKPMKKNGIVRFIRNFISGGKYYDEKEDEIMRIQEDYSLFTDALFLKVDAYKYLDEEDALKVCIQDGVNYLREINYSNLQTIRYIHKEENLDNWFFNNPTKCLAQYENDSNLGDSSCGYLAIEINNDDVKESDSLNE